MRARTAAFLADLADALHAHARTGEPLLPEDLRAIATALDARARSLRNVEHHERRRAHIRLVERQAA